MANPVKFGTKRKLLFLEQLRRGLRRGAAARAVGVSRETVRFHQKHDPAFAAAVEDAEMEACEEIEDKLFELALASNFRAIQMILCNRRPDRWRWPVRPAAATAEDANQEGTLAVILARLEMRNHGQTTDAG